jgi:hypothetical protein
MPSEIINAVRAKSTIRIVGGAANTHINLVGSFSTNWRNGDSCGYRTGVNINKWYF